MSRKITLNDKCKSINVIMDCKWTDFSLKRNILVELLWKKVSTKFFIKEMPLTGNDTNILKVKGRKNI